MSLSSNKFPIPLGAASGGIQPMQDSDWGIDASLNIVNSAGRIQGTLGLTEFPIYSASDFPTPSAGVITLPTGVYDLKTSFSISDRFEIEAGATVRFTSRIISNIMTYTGTGVLFSNVSGQTMVDFKITQCNITLSGIGSQVFDIVTGFMDLSFALINATNNNQIIGTIQGGVGILAVIQINSCQFTGFAVGLSINNSIVFAIDGLGLQSSFATGNTMIMIGSNVVQVGLSNATFIIGGGESFVFLDPAFIGTAAIAGISLPIGGTFYQTGTVGSITNIVDSSFPSESITSITDSSGIARFNFSAPPTLFVGQEVVIAGFTTNTAYNGTFIITAVGAGYFEISTIAFGTNEGGGTFTSDTVTITSATHGQSELQTMLIEVTVNYDGGATIYNSLTNSFQINRTFVITETVGTWNTGSLTETDNRVSALGNTNTPSSTTSGQSQRIGNTDITVIPAQDAEIIMNVSSAVGTDLDRIKVLDNGSTVFTGLTPDTLKYDGNLLLEPVSGGTVDLACRFVTISQTLFGVTFTNGTEVINETSTALSDNDRITFKGNAGTIPSDLIEDAVYYVVNKTNNTFQVSFTEGGSVESFTDDGSGTNSYKVAAAHGSIPTEPIASNNARTLVPQSLHLTQPTDRATIMVINRTNSTNVAVLNAYYRTTN